MPYAIAIFGVAFLVSAITASIVTPVQNSDAIGSNLNLSASAVQYYVNISSNNGNGGTISKDIQTTYVGTLGIITDILKVRSNTPNGYYVYVSAANGHNQNLTNTDPNQSENHISPINTTNYNLANPGNLSAANTWGVAVADTYNANFDPASAYASDSAITQTTKFAPLPAYGHEELLITRTGNTYKEAAVGDVTQAELDTIPVYYGYHANSALPSGTYSNTVLYTAYAEATDQSGGVATYTSGNITYKAGGRATFTTSLYTDREVLPADVVLKVNGVDATVVSVNKVNAGTNDTVQVVADLPTQTKPGIYGITIDISKFAHHSATTIEYGTDGITIAEGKTTPAGTYTTMQSLDTNPSLCADWTDNIDVEHPELWDSTLNAPTAFTTAGIGYKYGADGSISEDDILADLEGNWTKAVVENAQMTGVNATVPEAYLKDTRDNNYYRVRKLADGNCWMTENLRLLLTANEEVVTQNSTWTPRNTTEASDWVSIWSQDDSGDIDAQIAAQNIAAEDTGYFRGGYYDHSVVVPNSATTRDGDIQDGGVLYNWNAATAGTGTWAKADATDSICPKGWQLPGKEASSKSWRNLLYVVYSASDISVGDRAVTSVSAHNATAAHYHLHASIDASLKAPLSFVFAGYHNVNSAAAIYPSEAVSTYWSSEAASKIGAYRMRMNNNGYFHYSLGNVKSHGVSVRCVSQ